MLNFKFEFEMLNLNLKVLHFLLVSTALLYFGFPVCWCLCPLSSWGAGFGRCRGGRPSIYGGGRGALSITHPTMALAAFLPLLALAAAQTPTDSATDAPEKKPTPVWYIDSSLKGTFSERSTACGQRYQEMKGSASDGPILIPANTPADICINFPARTQEDGTELAGGWRHDRGAKGDCANGCCE